MAQPRPLLAALLAVAVVGCTAADPGPTTPPVTTEPVASSTGGAAPSATETAAPVLEVLASEVISTDAEEYRVSFTPDGGTAYFARSDGFFPQTRRATILESHLVDGTWSEPVAAAFSGEYPDIDPWVAPDGESIYFSSIRPVEGEPRNDVELFRVDREGEGWGEPVHLAALGSERDELGPSVSRDGEIWFASDRTGGAGGWDIYSATPEGAGYLEPVPVAAISSPVWEFNPAVSADGSVLVFTSIDREGGSGLGDLFSAARDGDGWTDARPLAVNSSADEYHPSLSPDGSTLYFVRRAGDGDIHHLPWADVDPAG